MNNELFPGYSNSTNTESPPEERKAKFKAMQTREDIASILGLSYRGLCFQLYGGGKKTKYFQFEIPKKAGGSRRILAPREPWKHAQRALLQYLTLFYNPRSSPHGFITERSICTNANVHIRRRFVLNLDLKDFFPSITFPRVMGLFMKEPFNCPRNVAITLAQIVTHENELPQGAPTSPLISNMIAARLDSRLNKLAKKYRCRYTRYVDDITFSTNSPEFPSEIAEVIFDYSLPSCKLSNRLTRVIGDNGFSVNEEKVRVRTPRQRQEVTGLVVNRKINIPREYLKEVRAILFNWQKYGPEKCAETYRKKMNPPPELFTLGRFKQIIKGKVDYIGAVRGRSDAAYIKYLTKFSQLAPELITEKTLKRIRDQDKYQIILDKLVIVEVEFPDDSLEERDGNQGSGFFLKDVGLVTCAHLFQGKKCKIEIFRRQNPNLKTRADVNISDDLKDVAILDNTLHSPDYFEPSVRDIKAGDTVYLTGFPNYSQWNIGIVSSGTVTALRYDKTQKTPRIQISASIISGNSGGPVFDKDWKVIGIAARGAENQDEADKTEFHGVIPLSEIKALLTPQNAEDKAFEP